MHQNLFVFDIETIPDTEAIFNLTGSKETDPQKLRQELEDYHLDVTAGKNAFPRQLFHKVVAISFLTAKINYTPEGEEYELVEVRSGGNVDSTEEELVSGFFKYLQNKRPRFVSFNGRGFDLPVLKYRAMKYGISIPWYYNSGDKWNNYSQRYSQDWHCDLIEALSDYGASARIRLNEICSILGFPGKFGVDGGLVADMFDDGKVKEIRDYCETDVLNTYLVYLKFMQHKGLISQDSMLNYINDVYKLIENSPEKHFQEFKDAWDECRS